MGDLAPAEADALDVLAMGEPVGLTELEAMVGRPAIEQLDRIGAVALRQDGRRLPVTFAHPLAAEVWRDRMTELTRRRVLLEHVDRIERWGSRRRDDPIRVATARLDASGEADVDLLVHAARRSRFDRRFPVVERLARAATVDGMRPDAGLLLGEALHELGRFDAAEEVLAEAEPLAVDDVDLFVTIVSLRCLNLMWGLHRRDDALADSRAARERLGAHPAAVALVINEATLLTYSGRPQQALDALASLDGITHPLVVAGRSIAEIPALVAVGRPVTAAERARDAFTHHQTIAEPVAIADATLHRILEAYALAECGRFADGFSVADEAYRSLPPTDAPDSPMWLSFQLGRCSLLSGRPVTARRWLSEAAARCDEHHFVGPRRLALSFLATAHAWLGDAESAAEVVDELDGLPAMDFARAEQELGRAWASVAAGDVPRARASLLAAADDAHEAAYRSSEALLLHDVARLGDPVAAADRLEELAGVCEGPLVALYAAHARASAAHDADELAAVGDGFAGLGAHLLAAEALSEAGRAAQRGGESRRATGLFGRADTAAAECEGARTPALAAPTSFVPLTNRERDVATLAARGESSREIADRLYLSIRTVNNHLQHIYTKLGVNRRRDLAAALAELPEAGESATA
jgi:DNA-binding CsgD family transcriptional regulator